MDGDICADHTVMVYFYAGMQDGIIADLYVITQIDLRMYFHVIADDNAFAYELRRVIPDAEIIRTITRADIYSLVWL